MNLNFQTQQFTSGNKKMNNTELFMEVMKDSIQKTKKHISNAVGFYSTDEFYMSFVQKLRTQPDIDHMVNYSANITGKYFRYAHDMIQAEEYHYVQICMDIIDLVCEILYSVIKSEYKALMSAKDLNDAILGIEIGINVIKDELAKGTLYTKESELYD